MCEDSNECTCSCNCEEMAEAAESAAASDRNKYILGALLLGGAALVTAGVLCWWAMPKNRVERLLLQAQKKVNEIEEVLGGLAG
jgi:hypothetical protein